MRNPAFFATMILGAFLMSVAAHAAAPEGTIEIDVIRKNQPTVPFRHKSHKTLACRMCHHEDARGREQRCSGCHEEKADGKVAGLKEAYHRKCIACHKKARRGPVVCTRCHKLGK